MVVDALAFKKPLVVSELHVLSKVWVESTLAIAVAGSSTTTITATVNSNMIFLLILTFIWLSPYKPHSADMVILIFLPRLPCFKKSLQPGIYSGVGYSPI